MDILFIFHLVWNSKLGSIRPQVAILIWFPQSSLPRKIFNSCFSKFEQKHTVNPMNWMVPESCFESLI